VNALSEAARDLKIAIVIGANERVDAGPGNGTLYNALITISEDGRLANHHRKLVPTYTERLVWGNGDGRGLEAVPTSSGRVGGLICWASCPFPQTREDVAIHVSKDAFTHHVPMIVRPTANLGVELIDQIGGRHATCVVDDSSDALQEGSNILLGRLDEQFPVRVSAHILSEKIKAVLHVRNDGLGRRKCKTSFLQKLLDEGFDFSFQ